MEFGGEVHLTHGTRVYASVRHPHFPESPQDAPEVPDGDGRCRECGEYAHYRLLCDSCRADGWTDSHGMIEQPKDDGRWRDEENDWELTTEIDVASGLGS